MLNKKRKQSIFNDEWKKKELATFYDLILRKFSFEQIYISLNGKKTISNIRSLYSRHKSYLLLPDTNVNIFIQRELLQQQQRNELYQNDSSNTHLDSLAAISVLESLKHHTTSPLKKKMKIDIPENNSNDITMINTINQQPQQHGQLQQQQQSYNNNNNNDNKSNDIHKLLAKDHQYSFLSQMLEYNESFKQYYQQTQNNFDNPSTNNIAETCSLMNLKKDVLKILKIRNYINIVLMNFFIVLLIFYILIKMNLLNV